MRFKAVAIGLVAGVFLFSSVYAEQASSQQGGSGREEVGKGSSGAQGNQQQGGQAQDLGNGGSAPSLSDVKQVQQKLNDQGFNAGPVDGKFGPKTQDALRQFQQKQGIQPTGKMDSQTMAAMGVQGQRSGQGVTPQQGGAEPGGSQPGDMGGGQPNGGTQGTDQKGSDLGGGKQNGGTQNGRGMQGGFSRPGGAQ